MTRTSPPDAATLIGAVTAITPRAVAAALALFDEGATVPFIARYRKERTGGLDEVQLFAIEKERERLKELSLRREAIRKGLEELGALSPARLDALEAATTKAELEDLWLPFKKKKRTRASAARDAGLEPLAAQLLAQPLRGHPDDAARPFVSAARGIPDIVSALAGARDIAAEVIAETAAVRQHLRESFLRHGRVGATAVKKTTTGVRTPYEDYYAWNERLDRAPSHRLLAVFRGENEGFLKVQWLLDDERQLRDIAYRMRVDRRSAFAAQLEMAIQGGYERLLRPSIETEIRKIAKERADAGAIEVFARNLDAILLAPPLGQVPLLAIDPGLRTGAKVVALSATGDLMAHTTIFPQTAAARAEAELLAFLKRHQAGAIAIGNGTGGRETQHFVQQLLRREGLKTIPVVMVNEAGASIYSASEVAREEFPDLDLTWRGAISIGRRLQDPLAELVKLDPQSLGVGQYQHDVDESLLKQSLESVVDTAVNRVGVDLNSASPHLLRRVAGIGPGLAQAIVNHRREHGPFRSRRALLDVKGLGRQRFVQAAGFLRIRDAAHPLDASAVHPERYPLVERIAGDLGLPLRELVGHTTAVKRIDIRHYVDNEVGEPTLLDILDELSRPGRDPRPAFETPGFREDVKEIGDLKPAMVLTGVVTNVAAFGAFVDIGVHQDGLVHISALSDTFVKDPHSVVRTGQPVRVQVLEVDHERRRIALTMKGLVQPGL